MTSTPVYLETLNEHQDNAITNDDEDLLKTLDEMHKTTTPR